MTDRQMGTLVFHDKLGAVGVGTSVVLRRRWSRLPALCVRLRPLPAHVVRTGRVRPAVQAPPFRTASVSSSSAGVAETYPRGGGGTEKRTSLAVAPTSRGMTAAVPEGSSGGPPTRGETFSHSLKPPGVAIVGRAIDELGDVPDLMRRQKEDSLLGNVR